LTRIQPYRNPLALAIWKCEIHWTGTGALNLINYDNADRVKLHYSLSKGMKACTIVGLLLLYANPEIGLPNLQLITEGVKERHEGVNCNTHPLQEKQVFINI